MRKFFIVAFLGFCIVLTASRKSEADVPDYHTIFHSLSAYGNWLNLPAYGEVWQPKQQGADWRPYKMGRWRWSEYGWMWVSDEPWGWATYHYGTWYHDLYYGWVWVPGLVWGPSWVSWFEGRRYIGWAPLLPEGANRTFDPSFCVFIPFRQFLDSDVARITYPSIQNKKIINETTLLPSNNDVLNLDNSYAGPNLVLVRRITRRRISKVLLASHGFITETPTEESLQAFRR